jgi:hypothetical protein
MRRRQSEVLGSSSAAGPSPTRRNPESSRTGPHPYAQPATNNEHTHQSSLLEPSRTSLSTHCPADCTLPPPLCPQHGHHHDLDRPASPTTVLLLHTCGIRG